MPHFGSLPREQGLFAPVVFVDPTRVQVDRWYYHRLPDFAARCRNLLIAHEPGRPGDRFGVVAIHGDIHDPHMRLADARSFDRLVRLLPCMIVGDWNTTPSGPSWEPDDLDNPAAYTPADLASRIRWRGGPDWARPPTPDTAALDYLIGYWDPTCQRRVGGIGWYDVAELAGDHTGTYIGGPWCRRRAGFDRMLVNTPSAIVPGSYHVYEPDDPDDPDSDHLRISVTWQV